MSRRVTLEELRNLVVRALVAHNTSEANAADVAEALVAAEADGQRGHGLSRVASYAAQARSGKVDGHASPVVERPSGAALRIDAAGGFAYPAIKAAVEQLPGIAAEHGIAIAGVTRSHHCGAVGHHVEQLAKRGMIGLFFSNTPEAIAPWGGNRALFGTNPIAFAAPREEHDPVVIDLSLSKVARGKIKVAAQKGEPIPEGWALDAEGNPTTDARAAAEGTMLPMGDAKGSALVLMVEILAAALTGSHFGFEASSFFKAEGPSPGIGQTLIAIAPGPLSKQAFGDRLEVLLEAILEQPGTRLPGARRFQIRREALEHGIELDPSEYQDLLALADG